MRKLMHHNQLYAPETQPVTRVGRLENELDDLSSVEVAADEFGVGFVFFEGHYGEVISFHNGVTYRGDTFEEVLGEGAGGTWEGLDEYYAGIGGLVAGVETLDSKGHSWYEVRSRD